MSAVPEIIAWKMRIATKLNSQPRPRPEQRWAQTQTIEQRQLQELIALRTECHADSQLGCFDETQGVGRSGRIQGASNCALNVPTNPFKLLIWQVGARREAATWTCGKVAHSGGKAWPAGHCLSVIVRACSPQPGDPSDLRAHSDGLWRLTCTRSAS